MIATLKSGYITLREAADAVGGELRLFGAREQDEITNIAIDSRDCTEGSLFVAIKGERTDGHGYIGSAIGLGAVCVFAQYLPKSLDIDKNYAIIVVDDPIGAVGRLAKYYSARQSCKIVAVTGSVGKTTTKEFIYAVLSQKYNTYKSEGNHNNELGLPLTLLGMPKDTEWAVLEMGMSALGEIEYLSKIAEPDIAIVTNIGSSHLEHLKTRENICRAKMEIVCGLKSGGALLLNGDEPMLLSHRGGQYSPSFVSLGSREGEYRVQNIRTLRSQTVFDLVKNNVNVCDLCVPTVGEHNLYAAAFAFAVGELAGMSISEIAKGLSAFKAVGGRQNIYSVGSITVIDDCYNASPESMRASLCVLDQLSKDRSARRIALLGDMRELGQSSTQLHREIGEFSVNKVDILCTFGVLASAIADGAVAAGLDARSVISFTDPGAHNECGQALCSILREGDILLVKASRAMEAEKIIGYIKERKGE